MPIIVVRDHEFDLILESDARIISVLVAIAVGILLLSTIIFFYGYRVLRVMRNGFQSSSHILNKADTEVHLSPLFLIQGCQIIDSFA